MPPPPPTATGNGGNPQLKESFPGVHSYVTGETGQTVHCPSLVYLVVLNFYSVSFLCIRVLYCTIALFFRSSSWLSLITNSTLVPM